MANQSLVRYVNERRILTLLRLEGAATRADIARRLSLTRSTITNLVDDLIARKLVREMSPSTEREKREIGRPGIDVELNPTGAYFLGVEIDVGAVNFAILDLAGKVAETKSVPGTLGGPEETVALIASFLARAEEKRRYRGHIRAIGMTVPGLVRSDGFVVHLPVIGWKNVNLPQLASRVFDVPSFIENNTNAAAFGEIYTHPRPEHDCILYLKLGIGCGGAAIVNGRLLRGASGMATEFGHIHIAETGPTCSCGRRGCLETFVNLAALASVWSPEESVPASALPGLPAVIVAAAGEDEAPVRARARAALDTLGDHLVTGLVSLTNTFNPREVVLGGIMRPVIAEQLERLRRGVKSGVIPGMTVPTLSLSAGAAFECAIGAAAIAHHESFDVSNIELEVIEEDTKRNAPAL